MTKRKRRKTDDTQAGRLFVGYTVSTRKLMDKLMSRYPAVKRATFAAYALRIGLERLEKQPRP